MGDVLRAQVQYTVTDLGTLGGAYSYAYGINNNGQVVGWAYTSGNANFHAFLWQSDSGMQDLGTLGETWCSANGINNNGQIVGGSHISINVWHAFLYIGSTMIDLNTLIDPSSGWSLEAAFDINDLGDIVGYGWSPSGTEHAFLLTPVPEPSTLVLLGIGAVSLTAYSWRRHSK